MAASDPQYRRAIARAAGLERVAQVGGAAVSAPARQAQWEQLKCEVDPNGELPEDERERRAQAKLRARMTLMAAKSAKARRERAAARRGERLEAELAAVEPVDVDPGAVVDDVMDALESA